MTASSDDMRIDGELAPHSNIAEPLLEIVGLSVTYGGVRAVDDVSLTVREGTIVGLIGPNGAGKTSMIDALTGYYPASGGTVTFAGVDISRLKPYLRARQGFTRTFQSIELFDDLTVRENVRVAAHHVGVLRSLWDLLFARKVATATTDWALSVCGLDDSSGHLPTEISHGHRKLTGVARALARKPRLVVMDEPAAGLDPSETQQLAGRLQALPQDGVTVLLIDHDMDLVLQVCDYIYVLDFGKLIAQGSPAEIVQDRAVITAYLGTQRAGSA